jgi:hypothetical protein
VWGVVVGQDEDESSEGVGLGGFDVFGDGVGFVVAGADGVGGQAVEDAGEHAPVTESGLSCQALEGSRLGGDAERQCGSRGNRPPGRRDDHCRDIARRVRRPG